MSASGKNNIGILAGVDSTEEAVANTYSNILIYNGKVTGATSGVGGLFGDAPSAIIENVIVAGEGYYSSNYAGGIVGKDAKSIKNSVVIVDTIRATASNAGRITGEKLNICENVYSWYFTEAWEGGTLYDPRNPNTGIYGDNAFVTDFVDTTWWEDLGFKFSGDNSMWKLEHIDDQQVVPALKHMTDDTLTVPGLKLGIIAAGQKVITKPSHLNILHVGISDSFLYYPNESIDLRDWEDDWRLDLNGDDAGNWNPIATFKGNINSYGCGIIGLDVQKTVEGKQGFIAKLEGNVGKIGIYKSTFTTTEPNVTQGAIAAVVNYTDDFIRNLWSVGNTFSGGTTVGGVIGEAENTRTGSADRLRWLSAKNTIKDGTTIGGVVGKTNTNLYGLACMGNTIEPTSTPTINAIRGEGSTNVSLSDAGFTTIGGATLPEGGLDTDPNGQVFPVDDLDQTVWQDFFDMSNASSFTNQVADGRHYPTLKNVSLEIDNGKLEYFSGGSGAQGDPYLIATPADLKAIGKEQFVRKSYYFEQTQDIDMSGEEDFWPIGLSTTTNPDNPGNLSVACGSSDRINNNDRILYAFCVFTHDAASIVRAVVTFTSDNHIFDNRTWSVAKKSTDSTGGACYFAVVNQNVAVGVRYCLLCAIYTRQYTDVIFTTSAHREVRKSQVSDAATHF